MLRSKLAAAVTFLATAVPAYAHHKPGHFGGRPRATAVPEIDASAGLLALAAVATVMLFAWERRRRFG